MELTVGQFCSCPLKGLSASTSSLLENFCFQEPEVLHKKSRTLLERPCGPREALWLQGGGETRGLIIRNWLAWLWRLRSSKICKLSSKRAGDINSSLSVSPKLGEDQCPSSKIIRQREQILSCSVFSSIQAFNRLDEAHPCWGGQSALLGLPFQILISPRHIHTPRILFTQISGHPTSQSGGHTKLTVTSGLCWLTWSHSLGRALCGNTCSYQKLLQYQCTVIKPSLRSAVSKELKRYIKKCGAEMLS